MAMTKPTVNMNRHAIVDFVLYGPSVVVETFFRQFFATAKAIGKPVVGRAFRQPPRGIGAWPGLHDTMLWLDNLDGSPEKAGEVTFFHKLYNTAKARVRPEVIAELEKGTGDEHALA